jgi:hypothetical protein
VVTPITDNAVPVNWDDALALDIAASDLESEGAPNARLKRPPSRREIAQLHRLGQGVHGVGGSHGEVDAAEESWHRTGFDGRTNPSATSASACNKPRAKSAMLKRRRCAGSMLRR